MTDTEQNSLKARIIRSLESVYEAAFNDAMMDGEWKAICKTVNPSAALEVYCLKKTDASIASADLIGMLKKVKSHLIRLNLTVLEAYEKKCLMDAIVSVKYRSEHFKTRVSKQQPESSEDGWEDRVEAAMDRIYELQADQHETELIFPEAG